MKKLYVDSGDTSTGQLLAELDQGRDDGPGASVRGAACSPRKPALKGAEADLERAEVDAQGVDLPTLKRAYDRAQQMASDGVVSRLSSTTRSAHYEMAVNKQRRRPAQ